MDKQTEMIERVKHAEALAENLCKENIGAKVWSRGSKVRVYMTYPRGYQGSAGGGAMGYLDVTPDGVKHEYFTDPELCDVIREAVEGA